MKLSVAIITYNEQANIGRTLAAVSDLAEEIIIVDSHSTDKTKAIAQQYKKVKFYTEVWKGDGLQKQSAIDKCTAAWILLLDADEEISPKLKKRIEAIVFKNEAKYRVYDIRLISVIGGKTIRYGGWSNVTKRILFKRDSGFVKPVRVHAGWQSSDKVGKINAPINHYLYKNTHHHLEKLNIYTTEQAKINYNSGKTIGLVKVILLPFFHFFKMYIFRLGFLDGITGFYLAAVNYFYAFLKYYKLYRLCKKGEV